MSSIKEKLITAALVEINQRIETAQSAINSAEESKLNETKSSAGDKFETGRAMMQLEQEKAEVQLANAVKLKHTLNQIDLDKKHQQVNHGCLVITNQLNYIISIAVGKLLVENEDYYAISLSSPIGKLLLGKSIGEEVTFRGRTIRILNIT